MKPTVYQNRIFYLKWKIYQTQSFSVESSVINKIFCFLRQKYLVRKVLNSLNCEHVIHYFSLFHNNWAVLPRYYFSEEEVSHINTLGKRKNSGKGDCPTLLLQTLCSCSFCFAWQANNKTQQ